MRSISKNKRALQRDRDLPLILDYTCVQTEDSTEVDSGSNQDANPIYMCLNRCPKVSLERSFSDRSLSFSI